MQSMQILVLGPEGSGRAALEETLARLGYVAMAADPRPDGRPPASGDIVMVDLRGGVPDQDIVAQRLHDDERPLVVVSERPAQAVQALARRPGGTMLMTGAESDAGFRVALSLCAGLRRNRLGREAVDALSVAV